jgi:hypothetical protein
VFGSLNFGLRDLSGEHPRDPHAVVVHVEHDADGILLVAVKDGVKDLNDKLPGSVIIIVQKDSKETWAFEFFLRFDLRDGSGIVLEAVGHTLF